MKTISIVGANSFVGQHLTSLLLQDASLKLKLLSHSAISNSEHISEHVQYLKGDLLNPTSLNDFVHNSDIVINLAYLRGGTIEDNVAAVKNLYNVSEKHGVKRFIHCSTAVVVGRAKETVINENSICVPKSNYEKSKYEVEQMLLTNNSDNCGIIILRPTAVFGFNGKNIVKIINDIRSGNKLLNYIKYYIYGYRKLNLVPVENVVGAIAFLIDYNHKLTNEVFIVSSDNSSNNNYRYLADAVLSKLGRSNCWLKNSSLKTDILKYILFCSARTVIEPMRTYSSEKLYKLGYVPCISFELALEEYIECQLSGSS